MSASRILIKEHRRELRRDKFATKTSTARDSRGKEAPSREKRNGERDEERTKKASGKERGEKQGKERRHLAFVARAFAGVRRVRTETRMTKNQRDQTDGEGILYTHEYTRVCSILSERPGEREMKR